MTVQEAEVKGQVVPEPLDVRTEHAVEAGENALEGSSDSSKVSSKTINRF